MNRNYVVYRCKLDFSSYRSPVGTVLAAGTMLTEHEMWWCRPAKYSFSLS